MKRFHSTLQVDRRHPVLEVVLDEGSKSSWGPVHQECFCCICYKLHRTPGSSLLSLQTVIHGENNYKEVILTLFML
ncbi:hypothetical protein ANTPLA_LOCUS9689 [Anthophora plagiata]